MPNLTPHHSQDSILNVTPAQAKAQVKKPEAEVEVVPTKSSYREKNGAKYKSSTS